MLPIALLLLRLPLPWRLLRLRIHEARLSCPKLQLEPQLLLHRLRRADGAPRAADGPVANQLRLGRGQLADLADRPPIPTQLPRQRRVRRPVPPDATLA